MARHGYAPQPGNLVPNQHANLNSDTGVSGQSRSARAPSVSAFARVLNFMIEFNSRPCTVVSTLGHQMCLPSVNCSTDAGSLAGFYDLVGNPYWHTCYLPNRHGWNP